MKIWFKDDLEHRDGDKPSLVRVGGEKHWCKNGVPSREGDKPAIITGKGLMIWFEDGHPTEEMNPGESVRVKTTWYKP